VLGRRATTPLEKRLGYRFRRPELLQLALTHRSRANEEGRDEHYERLEFLGDAVLGLVTAEQLYLAHRDLPEGELSKRKAQLVSRSTLAQQARDLDLGSALRLGVGEERSGGRSKPSLLADSLEAVLGAVYLDGGLGAAARVIAGLLGGGAGGAVGGAAGAGASGRPGAGGGLGAALQLGGDAKTTLQESVQAHGWRLPEYRLTAATGPDHSKHFTVEVWVAGRRAGSGEGASKKMAEQRAAADALAHLDEIAEPSEAVTASPAASQGSEGPGGGSEPGS
jgi:ribonuclease-3